MNKQPMSNASYKECQDFVNEKVNYVIRIVPTSVILNDPTTRMMIEQAKQLDLYDSELSCVLVAYVRHEAFKNPVTTFARLGDGAVIEALLAAASTQHEEFTKILEEVVTKVYSTGEVAASILTEGLYSKLSMQPKIVDITAHAHFTKTRH